MLKTLIESRRKAERSSGGTAASIVLHAVLILLAVAATATARDNLLRKPKAQELVYIPLKKPAPKPAPVPRRTTETLAPLPVKGFKLLIAPPKIPDHLPPIDYSGPVTNPRDFSGVGAPGGRADGVERAAPVDPNGTYLVGQVEKQTLAFPDNPKPVYPSMLESAHVAGSVLVQFVVDTTGRVDMRTFTVLDATNALFVEAVKHVLPGWKFYPAEAGGHKVKQLVQMPFAFTVP